MVYEQTDILFVATQNGMSEHITALHMSRPIRPGQLFVHLENYRTEYIAHLMTDVVVLLIV